MEKFSFDGHINVLVEKENGKSSWSARFYLENEEIKSEDINERIIGFASLSGFNGEPATLSEKQQGHESMKTTMSGFGNQQKRKAFFMKHGFDAPCYILNIGLQQFLVSHCRTHATFCQGMELY